MLHERFHSIDIVKGTFIFLILIISVLFIGDIPLWHEKMTDDGTAGFVAGILFPGLLFMFGMTIPFSIMKKINNGLSGYDIIRQVFARTVILIAVGVLMVNATRVEPELTGFSGEIWAILLSMAVFLAWNRYQEKENNFFTTTGLRLAGLAILVFIVFKFRSGTYENNGSLIPGWWELPGLAGWGYLISAVTFLAFRNSFSGTFLIWLIFMVLSTLRFLGMSGFMDPVRPYFGVITDGYIPSVILAGHLAGIMLKKSPLTEIRKPALIIAAASLLSLTAGIILRRYSFPEGIYGNPAMVLISCGAAAAFFILVFWLDEIAGIMNSTMILRQTGSNMFSAYLIQFFLFNIVWLSEVDVFFFLASENRIMTIAGPIVWALIVMGLTNLLASKNIRLKF